MTARSAILVQSANGTLHTAELGFFPLQSRAHRLHEVIGTQQQSQIQDFPKGAAPFVWSAKSSTRFSGGGGSSRICPSSPRVDAIQWGGGVVAEFFRGLHTADATHAIHFVVLSINPTRRDSSVGGGVVPAIFR